MYKQVIVIRNDLGLSIGKAAAQACHACYESSRKSTPKIRQLWENEGQKKIVLVVEDLKQLRNLKKDADKLKLPNSLISDAGLTEIKKGTVTCLGIGPDKEERIDKVTGNLKLLK